MKDAAAVKAAQSAEELASLGAHCRILESRIERYQALCAAAYQLAGAVDAPLRFLDALSEGANGNPLPEDMSLALLPVTAAECDQSTSALQAEIDRLNAIINTPHTDNFLQAVSIEAEHQRQRWNDSNKAPADWFWLVGYLAGKALAAVLSGDHVKAKHHMVTTAAALANWHRTGTCPHGHTGDWSDNCPDCRH
ncbi:hypothetical protein [Burkholderia cenocepacia]|uniref:hypothetical protein n=1 Tax=Burkholderia cenocepacia TaxID=95486 RepID=UPI002ABDE366|nr:hypothetical protein [Burkholderia cenocepacia]